MKNCDEEMGGMGGARPVKLKDVKHGDFFKLTNSSRAPVWIRGDYERSDRRYHCVQYWDLSHTNEFRPDRVVYVGFSF